MVEERTYAIDEIEERTGFDRRTIAYYVQQGVLPKVGRRGPRTRYSQLFLDRLLFIKKIRELQDQGAMGTMTLGEFRDLFKTVPEEAIAEVLGGREPLEILDAGVAYDAAPMASARERKRAMAKRIENLRTRTSEEHTTPAAMEPPPDAETGEFSVQMAGSHKTAAFRAPTEPPRTAAERRDTPSGELHRLTLDALERSPDAPEPERLSPPAPPVEHELREALARLNAVVKRQPRAYLRTTETWTRARVTEEISLSARGLDERHLTLLDRVAQILRQLLRDQDSGI